MNLIPTKETDPIDGCEVLVFSGIENQKEMDGIISEYPPDLRGGNIVSDLEAGICRIKPRYNNCFGQ